MKLCEGKRGKRLVIARTGTADLLTGRQTMRGIDDVVRYEDILRRYLLGSDVPRSEFVSKLVCFCKAGSWIYVRRLSLFLEDDGTIECWQGHFILKTKKCGTTLYFLEYSIAYLRIQLSSMIITNRLLNLTH